MILNEKRKKDPAFTPRLSFISIVYQLSNRLLIILRKTDIAHIFITIKASGNCEDVCDMHDKDSD